MIYYIRIVVLIKFYYFIKGYWRLAFSYWEEPIANSLSILVIEALIINCQNSNPENLLGYFKLQIQLQLLYKPYPFCEQVILRE